jgi:hypothetical protein
MEEMEREERKPEQDWNGQERRSGEQGEYQGDERRKDPPMERMPGGNPQGGNPGQG